MGLDFVSGQYGCLFSRCRKYVIKSLLHGHFHIGLVIIPRPIYGGLGMITRPIWKCPCIFTCENISFFPPELLLHNNKCGGYVPCCVTVNTHTRGGSGGGGGGAPGAPPPKIGKKYDFLA